MLFVRPDGAGAKLRAAERKDDDVLARLREQVATLTELLGALDYVCGECAKNAP